MISELSNVRGYGYIMSVLSSLLRNSASPHGDLVQAVLTHFTAPADHYLDVLQEPFQLDNYLCASNGGAFVFIERYKDAPILSTLKEARYIDTLLERIRELPVDNWIALPDLVYPTAQYSVCEECDGAGTVSFENDYNEYSFTCASCDGEPRKEIYVNMMVFDRPFNPKHIEKIAKLPDLTVSLTDGYLYFKFSIGHGVIKQAMPIG